MIKTVRFTIFITKTKVSAANSGTFSAAAYENNEVKKIRNCETKMNEVESSPRSWHSHSGSGHGLDNVIKPDVHCDCSSPGKLSHNFVTVLVTVHYLTLLCTKYCASATKVEKRRWRPSYMPPSSTTETATAIPSWEETTLIQSQNVWKVLSTTVAASKPYRTTTTMTTTTTTTTRATTKPSKIDQWKYWCQYH